MRDEICLALAYAWVVVRIRTIRSLPSVQKLTIHPQGNMPRFPIRLHS
jgi:hypothetical protein